MSRADEAPGGNESGAALPLHSPHEALDIAKAVHNLHNVGLFEGLQPAQFEEVARLCQFYWFSPGDYLIREGADSKELFILLRGEVDISKQLHLPRIGHVQGTERTLTRLKAAGNPILGETALVGGSVRTATVRCHTECAVYRIPAEPLRQLLKQRSELAASVYESLARLLLQRLDEASSDIVKLSAALVFALEE
ncbi:cyclic nucleotide-binding domain-containing protein [bacterium]|nr:cyclic nucleotide-binding domain-containing protein [bacterium]